MFALILSAFAQSPSPLTLTAPAADTEVLYVVVESAPSKRFLTDPAPTHVAFASGEDVRVLFREAGMVRVRDGERYGWVPESALGKEPPAEE